MNGCNQSQSHAGLQSFLLERHETPRGYGGMLPKKIVKFTVSKTPCHTLWAKSLKLLELDCYDFVPTQHELNVFCPTNYWLFAKFVLQNCFSQTLGGCHTPQPPPPDSRPCLECQLTSATFRTLALDEQAMCSKRSWPTMDWNKRINKNMISDIDMCY